jgi:hypothetical protein
LLALQENGNRCLTRGASEVSRWITTTEPTIVAMIATANAATTLVDTEDDAEGNPAGMAAWSLRRIRAEIRRQRRRAARPEERARLELRALLRQSARWARCDSKCARSAAVSSPS